MTAGCKGSARFLLLVRTLLPSTTPSGRSLGAAEVSASAMRPGCCGRSQRGQATWTLARGCPRLG